MGVIQEAGPDQYQRTGFAMAMCQEKYSDAFPLMYAFPSLRALIYC